MQSITGRVRNGHIVVEEPTNLPDGTEVELRIADGDDLDDEDRRRLHAALRESEEDRVQGRLHDDDDVLRELRR